MGEGEGAIIRGRRLIEGRLLFEEIRYFYCPLIARTKGYSFVAVELSTLK